MFNFIFFSSVNPSYVCLNICCNPAFLAAKSNKGFIINIIIMMPPSLSVVSSYLFIYFIYLFLWTSV